MKKFPKLFANQLDDNWYVAYKNGEDVINVSTIKTKTLCIDGEDKTFFVTRHLHCTTPQIYIDRLNRIKKHTMIKDLSLDAIKNELSGLVN